MTAIKFSFLQLNSNPSNKEIAKKGKKLKSNDIINSIGDPGNMKIPIK